MTRNACVWLLLASALALPAQAADPRGSAGAYAEAGDDGGLGFIADLTLYATERTSWYASASYADTTSGRAPAAARGLETGIYHDFGDFGLDIGLGTWSDPGLARARHAEASLDWHGRVWSVALLGHLRRTDFDAFQASGTVTLRDGRQVVLSATADCASDDTGLGLRIAFARGAWDGYARGMSYDYDATRCQFSSPGLQALARTRPDVFSQFAPRITAMLSAFAATRVGAENALLKDSLSVGIAYKPGRVGFGADFSHHRELFAGLGSDTLSGRVSLALSDTVEASLTVGATDGDAFDTVAFAGVGLRTRF